MKRSLSFAMLLLLGVVFIGLLSQFYRILPQYTPNKNEQDSSAFTANESIETTDAITYYVYMPFIYKPTISPKKGLAATPFVPSCTDASNLNTSWYYNWGAAPDAGCPADEKFVPRISYKNNLSTSVATAIQNAQQSGWIIGFNEPNLPGTPATMTPAEGAILWKQIETAVQGTSIKLVSPAPNPYSPGYVDPYGYTWLMAMVNAYKAQNSGALPRFDAIGWHIYYFDSQVIQNFLNARHNEFDDMYPDAKIWVLEYNGCFVTNKPDQIMKEMTPWFEQQSWIERYAWFNSRPDANPDSLSPCTLMDTSGNLYSIGQLYQQMSLY